VTAQIHQAVKALVDRPIARLGAGKTAERWLMLYGWARSGSVSLARLAEAHLDATAILDEADRELIGGALYGVWASGGPSDTILYDPTTETVSGSKPFCSGLGVVDRALVSAQDRSGNQWLLDVEVSDLQAPTPWATQALVDTMTGEATISERGAVTVGNPGFYLGRIGFWHGAIGPAACWAGAASGVADWGTNDLSPDANRQVAQGALLSQQHLVEALLRHAGDLIDHGELDAEGARAHALTVRHLIERSCAAIVDQFGQAFGPRPFIEDPELAQRVQDTQLYCRQQHGDSDVASIAKATL